MAERDPTQLCRRAAPVYTCEWCAKLFKRKLGGAEKRKGYSPRWCSRQCLSAHKADAKSRREPKPKFTRVRENKCRLCDSIFWTSAAHKPRPFCDDWCKRVEKLRHSERKCKVCDAPFFLRGTFKDAPESGALVSFCSEQCREKASKAARIRRRHRRGGDKYRARAKRAGVAYEPVNVYKVFDRDGWRCQICGKETPRARRGSRYSNAPELDHRIPFEQKGPHLYSNVQCSCKACNSAKRGKHVVGQFPLLSTR
jgi:hypothetical protein